MECSGWSEGVYTWCNKKSGAPSNGDGFYRHRLDGRCECGKRHDQQPTAILDHLARQLDSGPEADNSRPSRPGNMSEAGTRYPTSGGSHAERAKIERVEAAGDGACWRIIPSVEWLREQQANGHKIEEFWGRFLPKGAAILLVGEASAGKTVLLHRLGRALAAGEEFLGLKPPRPLRVLHIDLESPETLRAEIVDTIGPVLGWDFVKIEPSSLHTFLRLKAPLYDVIIVDSLQVAFPVKDENDNAEANRQISPFVEIAHKFGMTIAVTHNAGEGKPQEKYKSRWSP